MEMTLRTRCRLCDSPDIALASKFADMPQADAYTRDPESVQPLYPCELWVCHECGHAQITQVVNPETLFRTYLYRTGDFPYIVDAFGQFAYETWTHYRPQSVIDIGSNDGTMLGFFKDRGCEVLGIDPSDVHSPHPTVREFFGSRIVLKPADLVLAFNSFAHCDDLSDYVEGVRNILKPDGVFIFEAAYLCDIVPGQFDKFDHEHLSYHSVGPLVPFFEKHGLELFDVTRNPARGGSIRGYVQHKGGKHPKSGAVDQLLAKEEAAGFRSLTPYKAMQEQMDRTKARIQGCIGPHGIYAGFGASASTTPLIYGLGLQDRIAFLVDDNPLRHGLYSPGAHIPVREAKAMSEADYVLLLAWRYADRIMCRHWLDAKWVKVMDR